MNLILEKESMRMKEKEQWLEAVVKNLGKALLTTDMEGNVTFLNEPASNLVGMPENESIGYPVDEVLPLYATATKQPFAYPIQAAIAHRAKIHPEQSLFLKHPDGRNLYTTCTISPLVTAEGEIQGSVVLVCTFTHDPKIVQGQKALELLGATEPERPARHAAVFTKKEGQFVRVLLGDILWVEAMENYVQLVTSSDRYVVHTTMKKLAQRLAEQGFIRVHRSYIIALDQVEAIEENRIYIGEVVIPIGKAYRSNLMKALTLL